MTNDNTKHNLLPNWPLTLIIATIIIISTMKNERLEEKFKFIQLKEKDITTHARCQHKKNAKTLI